MWGWRKQIIVRSLLEGDDDVNVRTLDELLFADAAHWFISRAKCTCSKGNVDPKCWLGMDTDDRVNHVIASVP